MALSIAYWVNYCGGEVKLQRRSENAVHSNHVLKFSMDKDLQVVNAVVQASMRDRSYSVQIALTDGFSTRWATCECVSRNFVCHHRAAVLLYGYKNVSKTDLPCSWLKRPKSAPKQQVKEVAQLFPGNRPQYRALKRPVSQDDKAFLFKSLSNLGYYTAMHWILSPEPSQQQRLPVPIIEDLLTHEDFIKCETPQTWLRRSLVISSELVELTASQTSGQRSNPLWSALRKYRLTASNFGVALDAIRRNRFPASLKTRLVSAYNLEHVAPVSWGIVHEAEAIKSYENQGAVIQPTGLWLHESGCLGASPDGFVTNPSQMPVHFQTEEAKHLSPELIEVKCPYSARDLTVARATAEVKDFFLVDNGGLKLKPTHQYYHQIQGQLYLTKKMCCDLVVWTTKDCQTIRICRDQAWIENIAKLIDFFFQKFIPSLIEHDL